jgi:hypothetical protein
MTSIITFCSTLLCLGASGATVRVNPATPPPGLAAVRAAVAERGAVTCSFTESRKFPFRKTPAILKGTSDYLPGRGLILHYTAPKEHIMALVPNGIVEQDSTGVKRLQALPQQYENMLSLYDLDLAKLAEDFDITFEGGNDGWTIRLAERPGAVVAGRGHTVQTGLIGITIRGSDGEVNTLEIVKPGAITIEIRMENVRRMTLEETDAAIRQLQP